MLHPAFIMAELASPIVIEFPARWVIRDAKSPTPTEELKSLAQTLAQGCEAIHGLYLRMCDLIRREELSDQQVRDALESAFSAPRISEILRVSRAPDEVYRRYRAGFFGFKAALQKCRGYSVTPSVELRRRKIRRTAERLLELLGGTGEVAFRGFTVKVSCLTEQASNQ